MMKQFGRHFGASTVIAVSVIAATTVHADDHGKANRYLVTPLTSNLPNGAKPAGISGSEKLPGICVLLAGLKSGGAKTSIFAPRKSVA